MTARALPTEHVRTREAFRIGFGTIHLTVERGFGALRSNAIDLLKEAAELGVVYFDTADSYGPEWAERAVKDALYPYRDVIIMTKGGFHHTELGKWTPDGRPSHLRKAVEGSLRRLGVETIKLYFLHTPDPRPGLDFAESVGTLAELQRAGKIEKIGVSNVDMKQLLVAQREAEVFAVQNPYNIRYLENADVLAYCEDNEIAFFPWMPLGDRQIGLNDPALQRIAAKHGATPSQILLASLLHRSQVMFPIPGTNSSQHLRENMSAARIRLHDDDLAQLWPDWRQVLERRAGKAFEAAQASPDLRKREIGASVRDDVFLGLDNALKGLKETISEVSHLQASCLAAVDRGKGAVIRSELDAAMGRLKDRFALVEQAVERSRG